MFTGLKDDELLLVRDRGNETQVWYLTEHLGTMADSGLPQYAGDRSDWRICEGATNGWIGTIEDQSGDEVIDLSALAIHDFPLTYEFAREIVTRHNRSLLDPPVNQ